jgi:hypothetical protein
VIGDANGTQQTENGTGFLIETTKGLRIVTAGHVIKPDRFWDDPKNRLIYYRLARFGSSFEPEPVTEAEVDTDVDIAQVYIDHFDTKVLPFSESGQEKLFVASWRRGSRKATIQEASRLPDPPPGRLSLSGDYVHSDSGSPVISQSGQIVGMLIDRSTGPDGKTHGLALPLPGTWPQARLVLAKFKAQPVLKRPAISREALNFDELDGTCTFLGKRSARVTRNPFDMPFGSEILADVINPERRSQLMRRELPVMTPVNLRSRCPVLIDGAAFYGKIITRLERGDRVVPKEILALEYLDDVFYWTVAAVVRKKPFNNQ